MSLSCRITIRPSRKKSRLFLCLCVCCALLCIFDFLPFITLPLSAAICVELYKLLLDKPIEQLRNTFSNLALPLFTSAEPDPPKHTTALVNGKEWKWTQVQRSV